MPELPEVESIVRGLAPTLPRRAIEAVEIHRPDVLRVPPDQFRADLSGATIQDVTRRGKNIVIRMVDGRVLVVNLGMTGRLLLGLPGRPLPPANHVAVRFDLGSDHVLLFDDVRRFGALEALSASAWASREAALGREPLGPDLRADELHSLLGKSRSPIRSWLLDQRKLAGVGNIYAAEALFRAGIHPHRPANSTTSTESEALLGGLREVLQAAIGEGGTTLRDYRKADGEPGKYGRLLRVYGRKGAPCYECSDLIERTVLSNRSAFHCPTCQPVQDQG